VQDLTFGDLESEPRPLKSGAIDDVGDMIGKVEVFEDCCTQIESIAHLDPITVPDERIFDHPCQHGVGQLQDQAVLFCNWNENIWRNESEFGMNPACQAFGTLCFTARYIDLRLVVGHDLSGFNRGFHVVGRHTNIRG